MMRIGIIGGTFNPPHNGHLLIANEVREALQLSEVWFMPNNIPPHKESEDMASQRDRIAMIELAIEDNPYFKLETIELQRSGKSFTIDTITLLNKRYGKKTNITLLLAQIWSNIYQIGTKSRSSQNLLRLLG